MAPEQKENKMKRRGSSSKRKQSVVKDGAASKRKRRSRSKKDSRVSEQSAPSGSMQIVETMSTELEPDEDIDIETGLDDVFFKQANKIIEDLMISDRTYEASKIQKYVNTIFLLNYRYKEEVKQNLNLRPEIDKAHQKLRYALELILGTEEKMELLKNTLVEAWTSSDASLLREQITKKDLEEVLIKCRSFELKETKAMEVGQEFGHLSKYKNMILRERDRLHSEVVDIEKRLQLQRLYSEALEYKNQTDQEQFEKLMTQNRKLDRERESMQSKVLHVQNLFDDQRTQMVNLQAKYDQLQEELAHTTAAMHSKTAEFERQKILLDRYDNENFGQLKQINKLEEDIRTQQVTIKSCDDHTKAMKTELKYKMDQLDMASRKSKKTKQAQNMVTTRLYKLMREKRADQNELNAIKTRMETVEKSLVNACFTIDELRRDKDILMHERDTLRNNALKLNSYINELKHINSRYFAEIDSLHLTNKKLNVKLDEAKIHNLKMVREQSDLQEEVAMLNSKNQDADDEVNRCHALIDDLNNTIAHEQRKNLSQKKSLESVHSEKMTLKRELYRITQERDNYSKNAGILTHQINQMTTELGQSMDKINHLNGKIEQMTVNVKSLEGSLRFKENIQNNLRKDLKLIKVKNENLVKTISEDERRMLNMSVSLDDMKKQRNLVGLQMVRRNDEIIMLKDRIKTMQFTLKRTEVKYNQHVNDIRILKAEIQNLRTERECLQRAIESTPDMRQEIIRLQRLLTQERLKLRAFYDDCKRPCGIHRWRILKGVDPSKFILIEKVQRLQRRNVKIEVHSSNLEQRLRESESIRESMKQLIHNMPIAELRTKVVETQRINRKQSKKLKSLYAEREIDTIELRERDNLINTYKNKLSRIHRVYRESSAQYTEPLAEAADAAEIPNVSISFNYQDTIFTSSNPSLTSGENIKQTQKSNRDLKMVKKKINLSECDNKHLAWLD